ncbi:MAG: ArsR family transcriptional regulator [Clostridiales bacterium]|nr:ArsR family transcriptional regulator [Clostridiales bacterium]
MDSIVLSGKRELDIFVNPQRQNLLRCMKIAGIPMTPKQLADRMGISPSSVQHHIKKLMELGLVELSHTQLIHGITASYYRASSKSISIGLMMGEEHRGQRLALMQAALSRTFSGYAAYCERSTAEAAQGQQVGDMLSGILHLGREEARELFALIRTFLDEHEQKGNSSEAWEYALIAYPVSEGQDG